MTDVQPTCTRTVMVGPLTLGAGGAMPLIAGPCLAESTALLEEVAATLADLQSRYAVSIVLKTSFDKANRSSAAAARGPGMGALDWIAAVARNYRLPLCLDVHLPSQVDRVAEAADLLQIPALLSRQTDLLQAAAQTGLPVLLKRGPFLSPRQTLAAVRKLEELGATDIMVAERGSSFGYERLVVDPAAIHDLSTAGWPLFIDASHAVQQPGALGNETAGNIHHLPAVARAGLAAGASGVFVETHPKPRTALSDRQTQVPTNQLGQLIEHLLPLWNTLQGLPAFALEENR